MQNAPSHGRSDSPMFWATIGAALFVLGGILIPLGAKPVGIGIVAIGLLVLGYAVYRHLTRSDEPPTDPGRVGIASSGKARVTTKGGRIANQDRSVDASDRSRVHLEDTDVQ